MLPVAVLLALQAPVVPDSSGYLDPGARALVQRARARRASAEQRITTYHARVTERISVGLRALRRDRTVYQRELVGRVAWHRAGPDSVTMLGAREAVPVVYTGVRLPEDLRTDVPDLGFDAAGVGSERLDVGIGDSEFVYDPLALGSEALYRFQSGDTTVIRFPNGRTIRLLELRISPRRDEFHLLAGSFWLEDEHGSPVRAVFRPARAWDLERDANDSTVKKDARYVPGFLKPIRGEVRDITVEFALIDATWWLPHLIAVDAVATAGSVLALPLRYERVFDDYEVAAGPPPPPDGLAAATLPVDSATARACHEQAGCRCTGHRCRTTVVVVPDDSLSLLASAVLTRSFDAEPPALTSGEAQELARLVGSLPEAPWQAHAPTLRFGPGGAGLLRYNRVEALSVGARLTFDLGRVSSDLQARIGVGDGWPNVELGLSRAIPSTVLRVAGYRRLATANPETKPFGIGNSLDALLLGRDDGIYFRSWGAEVEVRPAATAPQRYAGRLFVEWQRAAATATDASLAHVIDHDAVLGPNIQAERAHEVGGALTVRGARGVSTRGVTLGASLTMDEAIGTFDYARVSLTTRLTTALPAHLLGAVELGAGATGGDAPVQSRWYLGGPATLRGYGGGAVSGPDFWRGRLEVANAAPGVRLAAFADAGWAGSGTTLQSARPLWATGLGASLLDGILRIDLARALVRPTGWRVDCYADGIL